MAENDLRNLWKLHLVDSQLFEIRNRAAALDPGRKIMAELAPINAKLEAKNAHLKTLHAEQTDSELEQKSIDEKIKKFDKELYSGKVVNPREVAALQKEIQILKDKRGDIDMKLLELWDAMPPVKKDVEAAEALVALKKKELAEFQKKVLITKSQLEAEFKDRSQKRPLLAKEVSPTLLTKYEAIRHKRNANGMAGISKKGTCEECGTNLPTKAIETAKEGRIVTCESCHCILYYTEGIL
ncbi:MAG TPA: hypothetical protein VGL56_13880 [Fimbriimonadaceae bacterium]|jgi:hypothetical protein